MGFLENRLEAYGCSRPSSLLAGWSSADAPLYGDDVFTLQESAP
jgi:hypothetical protein